MLRGEAVLVSYVEEYSVTVWKPMIGIRRRLYRIAAEAWEARKRQFTIFVDLMMQPLE
jgi:hypothetical protein